ncbi:MAG: aspartyl/glutamyl-tRNA amidotransferase subunit A [Candidatus Firestonebacteria bacterium RIFOXYC2_FULL_39_67]|nr:MAG: aspartyl/glutamyl-tRNA amidotransferase subunit A [Candidatus Firestonebacteria bacterium RIFOXYD2_FULL_39_29]OGF53926.1 MAG: aspartyl/glutamyl-tRNA amidotransferase subunit A [Candidatus Firestonebacteria bacterium RIFOXYC2_FULL_39_67]
MNFTEMKAHELAELIRSKKVSSKEVTAAFIERIKKLNPKLNAFVSEEFESALKTAEDNDKKLSAGVSICSPLFGVPVALKDNMCSEGTKVTCCSKILNNFISPYDATIVEKLKNAGMPILGKCNMDEFAMGSSTENSIYGPSLNPWDDSRIPGGSSGGSAVAVSAGLSPLSLGSDTGGSIRQPASCCGVVGLKPTYGRVSRYGLIAFASSLDQIGPITSDVEDNAALLEIIAGYDKKDSTSINKEVPVYSKYLNKSIKGMKIALPKEYFGKGGLSEDVSKAVNESIETYRKLGAEFGEVSLPHTEYCLAAYYVIATAEASSNLARYDGVHYGYRNKEAKTLGEMFTTTRASGFGNEVKRRIMLGTYVLSAGYYDAYYLKAQKVRTLIKRDFDKVFEKYDCVLTPTAPTPAFKLGEKVSDPIQMYLSDIFTISANLAGIPGISIPCGISKDNLPIGLQLIGKPFMEGELLSLAHAFEQASKKVTSKKQGIF